MRGWDFGTRWGADPKLEVAEDASELFEDERHDHTQGDG